MESCSACGKSVTKDARILGQTGLKFHRACLEKMLENNAQDDDAELHPSTSAKKKDNSSAASSYSRQTSGEQWECQDCRVKNPASQKRCLICSKSKTTRSSTAAYEWNSAVVEEEPTRAGSSGAYKKPADDVSVKSNKKGTKYHAEDDDDHGATSAYSEDAYEKSGGAKKSSGFADQNPRHSQQRSESDDDQSPAYSSKSTDSVALPKVAKSKHKEKRSDSDEETPAKRTESSESYASSKGPKSKYIKQRSESDDDPPSASHKPASSKHAKSPESDAPSRDPKVKYSNPKDDSEDEQPHASYKKSSSSKPTKAPEPRSPSPQEPRTVYITDLPPNMKDSYELETLIARRIEDIAGIKPKKVKCYPKLGIGVIQVADARAQNRLNKVGHLALDPKGKCFIRFVETVELVSYVVLNVPKEYDEELPTAKEVSGRWVELHRGDKPLSCDLLNAQFPNIYCIVSSALEELINTSSDAPFSVKKLLGDIYYCADCCYFDELPRTVKNEHLRGAIGDAIGQSDLPPTSLCVQINRQTATACIISANAARSWSAKSYVTIDKQMFQKKNKLACRLLVHPIPKSFSVQNIIKHREFGNAVTHHKISGDQLILEISDPAIFEQCLQRGALRLDSEHVVHIDLCHTLNNPDGGEIDDDTWYETDMLDIKPDIMQFVANPKHKIFRFRWNPQIWNEQFRRVARQKRDATQDASSIAKGPTPDQTRHLLRVTVMLNTLAVIQKRSYMIEDREVPLALKDELKTIVYDHDSTLERREKLALTKTPYSRTNIRVVQGDCLIEYERMAKLGKRPVLLNMASATSPGGGFRKGDGAQEENIFRRSDYCRSLDMDLDEFLKERADRLQCSSECRLERIPDPKNMYPMNDYGAIYTSGITVFRKTEETGYAYMETPLENVCSIAMAAYRDPELKGNLLAPKYAVGTRKKIENIFAIAYHQKHDCLILSALGCGAFKNPPEHVAKLFHSVIEQYAGFFDTIVFAIVDDHNTGRQLNRDGNFRPFADILDGRNVEPSPSMNKPNTMIGPYRLLSDGATVSDVIMFDQTPCNFGAKCTEIYNHHHANQYSHPPLCIDAAAHGKCRKMDDPVHTTSFIHRNQCRDGGLCRQINDDNHSRQVEHPDYCPDGGRCQSQKEEHLKQYRHLPLCERAHKCPEYQKEIASHCSQFRHCAPRCPHGSCCVMFHDKNHLDEYEHPFPTPCPRAPFDCPHYPAVAGAKDTRSLQSTIQTHCITCAHVCKYGRDCRDTTQPHRSKYIHVARHECSSRDKCRRLNDEEHLNSFTHPNVPDIRPSCPYASSCRDLHKFEHKVGFRHPSADVDGVVKFYGSNENTNFVQNQKDNVACVEQFTSKDTWRPLPSGSIPPEILNWIRTVQPIHRCNPVIFESILLHGHVMSREYMEHLKDPVFVANSVLHHSRITRIKELKTKTYEENAKLFVTALVALEFENSDFAGATAIPATMLTADAPKAAAPYSRKELYEHTVKRKEIILEKNMSKSDLAALRAKAIEIAQASIKLHSNPAGIGYEPDKALGTDKLVFSVLGPHLGHYYGDVIFVFKREILHHPDANYSIQAATSFASGKGYKWRPWLGSGSDDVEERIRHYHRTKLNAAVPGYEYATAFELIALTSLRMKTKTMDVTLDDILEQWVKADSHQNIEAHLPQLIPLDYIEHIYMPKNLFSALDESALKAIDAVFKHRITLVPHDGDADQEKGPFGPTPNIKSRADYQNTVMKKLIERYKENARHQVANPAQGFAITVVSSDFEDHYVLPLTISQAYAQYRIESRHPSKDNIIYIYWKAMRGDMMLTLSNEEIDPNESQRNLRSLLCYVASGPSATDDDYHEQASYIAAAHPFQHDTVLIKKSYKAKSTSFYRGCNSSDFMTYCLQIHRSTGRVVLSHAGPNAIYNHQEIACIFGRSELDLNKMEFVHVSGGARAVAIRNLIIRFEKQASMHPTFDKDYKTDTPSTAEKKPDKTSSDVHDGALPAAAGDKPAKESGFFARIGKRLFGDSSPQSCPDNVSCLQQYSSDAKDHNAKFTHPCPYSERCRDKATHSTHTHEPHVAPTCSADESCDRLDDPVHRASHRHTGRPDFLFPCRDQKKCADKSALHRKRYSHGEDVFDRSAAASKDDEHADDDDKTPCKWGIDCRENSTAHRLKYSHPSDAKPHQPADAGRTPCKWGAKCHDTNAAHRLKYSHPSDAKPHQPTDDDKTPCKWGGKCHDTNAAHRARFFHSKK